MKSAGATDDIRVLTLSPPVFWCFCLVAGSFLCSVLHGLIQIRDVFYSADPCTVFFLYIKTAIYLTVCVCFLRAGGGQDRRRGHDSHQRARPTPQEQALSQPQVVVGLQAGVTRAHSGVRQLGVTSPQGRSGGDVTRAGAAPSDQWRDGRGHWRPPPGTTARPAPEPPSCW